jgi:hypothetical protein
LGFCHVFAFAEAGLFCPGLFKGFYTGGKGGTKRAALMI